MRRVVIIPQGWGYYTMACAIYQEGCPYQIVGNIRDVPEEQVEQRSNDLRTEYYQGLDWAEEGVIMSPEISQTQTL
jgi:hypothetical protein